MASTLRFSPTQLFGGAITADLPVGFGDTSQIRQIPDHQEVYLQFDGLTSIIFEINERVDETQAATDADALNFHFQDLVDCSGDDVDVAIPGNAVLGAMDNHPALLLTGAQVPRPLSVPGLSQPVFTAVLLILIRFPSHKTDIVITVNVPHIAGEYDPAAVDLRAGKTGPLIEKAETIRQRVLQSFCVRQWGLFGEE